MHLGAATDLQVKVYDAPQSCAPVSYHVMSHTACAYDCSIIAWTSPPCILCCTVCARIHRLWALCVYNANTIDFMTWWYLCMSVHVGAFRCIYVHVGAYRSMLVHIGAYLCLFVHIGVCPRIPVHFGEFRCMSVHIGAYRCISVHIGSHVCICVHSCACV